MAMLPVQAPSEQEPVRKIRPRLTGSSHRGLASRSDERLVGVATDGDERAFEVLYERHSPAILRYCRSLLRSTQEAEDVKQEVFVLAISALRRGAQPDAFRPWLYRIAHNACMSHLRMRRPVLVADNGVLVGPAAAAEPVQHHREELRQLLDDIGKLPDVQRGALLLREMDGFSYEQVGEVLGLPLSTVRASIFRARRTLQGLAAARDADCEVIQSELSQLADRRSRRGRHITSHLSVCTACRDFRDGLRRRPTVLGGVAPAGPLGPGLLLALKGKLLGGATASGGAGTAIATASGGAGAAKIAAVAASSIALLAGAGVEADRVIDHSRRDAAVTPRHATVRAAAAQAASGPPARATARRTAAGITVTGADGPRGGSPSTGGRAIGSPTHKTSSRAHARVQAHAHPTDAGTPAGAPATPRAAATAATAATHAGRSSGTADDREHRGESADTRDDERGGGSDRGSKRGDGSRESESDSKGSGGHDDKQPSQASPRSESADDSSGSGPKTLDDGDKTPRTPTPSRFENAGPPGRPAAAPLRAPGGTPPPPPAPARDPARPAGHPPAPDPARVDPPVEPPAGDA